MILVDETHAVMSPQDLKDLPEYSCSIPTLTTIGKRWRRGEPYQVPRTHWYMGEYTEHGDPNMVGIKYREILIVDSDRKEPHD